ATPIGSPRERPGTLPLSEWAPAASPPAAVRRPAFMPPLRDDGPAPSPEGSPAGADYQTPTSAGVAALLPPGSRPPPQIAQLDATTRWPRSGAPDRLRRGGSRRVAVQETSLLVPAGTPWRAIPPHRGLPRGPTGALPPAEASRFKITDVFTATLPSQG
ncbi:unnamed protein product, partial [Prorocentrum cordatum]